MAGFFVTATNTERGKTLITTALRLWLEQLGLRCLAMKPVQTGMADCRLSPDLYAVYAASYVQAHNLPPTEDELLQELAPLLQWLQPYGYREPCSPHLAAELDGRPAASVPHLKSCAEELQRKHCDVLLVEGAGGLMVPLDRGERDGLCLTMLDIAKELALPVILVAQSGLGAINDACLSLMAIQQYGLELAGFLLNDLQPVCADSLEAVIRSDNARVIAELTGARFLGTMPFQAGPIQTKRETEQLLRAFGALAGLDALRGYLPQGFVLRNTSGARSARSTRS